MLLNLMRFFPEKHTQMRKTFLFLLLLLSANIMQAQDTIYMKSRALIPAIITEVNDIEIKYKKPGQPEPKGIYSVFKYEVSSLHYANGNVVDFSASGNNELIYKGLKTRGPDISGQIIKYGIGISQNYYKRNGEDNLGSFWIFHNGNEDLAIGGNSNYRAINLSMNMPLGGNRRNWLGAGLQLIGTPKDAISASNIYNSKLNEIKLRCFYYNIELIYGRALDFKKKLIFVFEPSIDLGMMSGNIKLQDIDYKISSISGMGSHFAIGLDYFISKRFTANVRIGQKYMKVKESHESSTSSSGYANFYANPSINDDLLFISWKGPYIGLGLAFNLYGKMKTGR